MTDRRPRISHPVAIALLPALLGACGPTVTIVLLPEMDGRRSAVVVKQGDQELILGEPYAAARQTRSGSTAYQSSQPEVASQFGPALSAVPLPPKTFTLYFIEGKDELTAESKQVVDSVLREIAERPVPDLLVVGHTDTVGSDQMNDALGLQRAETVRSAMIRLGVAPENIHAISRGKRELALPTVGAPEPRNRRVEIIVR